MAAEGQYEHDSNSDSSFCYDRQSLKYSETILFFTRTIRRNVEVKLSNE